MGIEGIYRPLPKDDSVFDPEKHEKTVHKKGPLKGKETWIRKSASESDKTAEEEAKIRNSVAENQSWFAKLFGKSNKDTALGIAQEEALENELAGLKYEEKDYANLDDIAKILTISGKYNGYKLEIQLDYDPTILMVGKSYTGKIEDKEIENKKDAKKIWKKLYPLLKQRDYNRKKMEQTHHKLWIKEPFLEVLGLQPQRPKKEISETNEPKQLGPKKEE